MEELTRIVIKGKTYPIKLDINILEKIQDEYGPVSKFEMDILGLEYEKDENGNTAYQKKPNGELERDENGNVKPKLRLKEPSIKAIKTVLPAMINEGLSIEADQLNRPFDSVSKEFVFRNCAIPFEELARIIHAEFKKCFATKK